MDNFPNNSDKANETRPEVEAVVEKKSPLRGQFCTDGKLIANSVLTDIILPTFKKLVVDMTNGALNMLFYKNIGATSVNAGRVSAKATNYQLPSSVIKPQNQAVPDDLNGITVPTDADANAVLNGMRDLIARYGNVRASEMYALASKTAPYTYRDYGWDSVEGNNIIHTSEGVRLQLPKASYLK